MFALYDTHMAEDQEDEVATLFLGKIHFKYTNTSNSSDCH